MGPRVREDDGWAVIPGLTGNPWIPACEDDKWVPAFARMTDGGGDDEWAVIPGLTGNPWISACAGMTNGLSFPA